MVIMDFIISIIILYVTYLILKAIFVGLKKIFFSSSDTQTEKNRLTEQKKSSYMFSPGNLNWKVENDTLIINGTGDMDNYSEEKPTPWNNKHELIKKVIINSGINSIGDLAFRNCKKLQAIIIPTSVTYIGSGAFGVCENLEEITIPDNVTIIGIGAFGLCKSLKKVTLSKNTLSIGSAAFASCTNLKEIKLNENITSLGNGVFNGCTSLKEITIPANITSIGEKVFDGCSNLQKIFYPAGSNFEDKLKVGNNAQLVPFGEPRSISSNTSITARVNQGEQLIPIKLSPTYTPENLHWKIEGNTLTISGKGNMKNYSEDQKAPWRKRRQDIKKVVIEHGITSIDSHAFASCRNLTKIKLPKSITSIGEYPFDSCSDLKEITIPKNAPPFNDRLLKGNSARLIPYGATTIYITKINKRSAIFKLVFEANYGCESMHNFQYTWQYPKGNYRFKIIHSPSNDGILRSILEKCKNDNQNFENVVNEFRTMMNEHSREIDRKPGSKLAQIEIKFCNDTKGLIWEPAFASRNIVHVWVWDLVKYWYEKPNGLSELRAKPIDIFNPLNSQANCNIEALRSCFHIEKIIK